MPAAADAGVSLVTRWYSARIGEGGILDLRTVVFNRSHFGQRLRGWRSLERDRPAA